MEDGARRVATPEVGGAFDEARIEIRRRLRQTMNILMIDTSGPACGVAIMADGRLVYEAELTHKQTHSQRVMPMVDTALQ